MERQRYEITLRCGTTDSVFWTNRLEEVQPILTLACSGAQSDQNMALAVRDTITRARAECSSATSIGFNAMCRALLGSVDAAQPRPMRSNEGRDVVVEVQFAAHGATLDDCEQFVARTMQAALESSTEADDNASRDLRFSFNGPTVGHAWFQ